MKPLTVYLFFALLIFISCQKENFQDEPFYCEINGEVILANGGSGGWFGLDPINAQYDSKEKRIGFLVFNEKDDKLRSLNLVASTESNEIESFNYTNYLNDDDDCIEYSEQNDYALHVEFIKLDSINSTVEMKFEGNLKNQCGEVVRVRNGRLKDYCFFQY